jgi:hypothetical protein
MAAYCGQYANGVYLIQNPEAGEVVPGSGGLRRYAGHGREQESAFRDA